MKNNLLKGIKFNYSVIAAGQKSATVNAVPQLTANSTQGKFTITAPVSKALDMKPGDYLMFATNEGDIRKAIADGNPEVITAMTENGYNPELVADVNRFVNETTTVLIGKGYLKFERNGEPLMSNIKLSKADKQAILDNMSDEEKMELVKANLESFKRLAEESGIDINADEDYMQLIAADMISGQAFQLANGSRTSTTSNSTSVGLPLGFTDTNMWCFLKNDIEEEERTAINRVFTVALDQPIQVTENNGCQDVTVTMYPLEFKEDAAPQSRGKKDEE